MRSARLKLKLAAIALAILGIVGVRSGAEWYSREPPNYSRIEEGLWLGGFVPKPPTRTQAVLNLCETEDAYRADLTRWEPIRDAEPAPSLEWLSEQVEFIESSRAGGRVVYVHCRNGVSRSAMVVAAYLMRREGWSRDQSLEFLRSRRPIVRPNPAFMMLLLEWERKLKG